MFNTPLFIAWRYLRSRHQNSLVSLISKFSTIGIALGVAVLIIGLSAMNGFQRELNNRILAVVPHMTISAIATSGATPALYDWKQLESIVEQQNHTQIKASAPFVTFTALLENGTKMHVAQIQGVDPKQYNQVSAIGQFVLNGAWQKFNNDSGIILGSAIARQLSLKSGDWLTLLLSEEGASGLNAQPKRFRVQVAGILRLDGELDYSYALLPLSQAQAFIGFTKGEVSGVQFSLKNPFAVNKLQFTDLNSYPQRLSLNVWTDKFGYMYRDIQLIRSVMYIAMILVIGIACFNIVSTLIMAVKDKQGDIAIMRTLGANNRFIKRIFLYYGLLSGMKGSLIGILVGVVLSLNLTEIIQFFEKLFHTQILSEGIYFVDFLPSELHWLDVAIVFAVAVLLSLLASIYPASRAVKLEPVKILSMR